MYVCISSPGRSPKQSLPGIGLHDTLHGRQACPEFTHLTRGLVKYVPGRDYFRAVSSQNGDKFVTSPPRPPIVKRVGALYRERFVAEDVIDGGCNDAVTFEVLPEVPFSPGKARYSLTFSGRDILATTSIFGGAGRIPESYRPPCLKILGMEQQSCIWRSFQTSRL